LLALLEWRALHRAQRSVRLLAGERAVEALLAQVRSGVRVREMVLRLAAVEEPQARVVPFPVHRRAGPGQSGFCRHDLQRVLVAEFDVEAGLFSLPRRLGMAGALRVAQLLHVAMIACLLALVWTLHPVQSAAVIYVAGRADPLTAAFGFLALFLALLFWPSSEHDNSAPTSGEPFRTPDLPSRGPAAAASRVARVANGEFGRRAV
jgi:hypothetical protein